LHGGVDPLHFRRREDAEVELGLIVGALEHLGLVELIHGFVDKSRPRRRGVGAELGGETGEGLGEGHRRNGSTEGRGVNRTGGARASVDRLWRPGARGRGEGEVGQFEREVRIVGGVVLQLFLPTLHHRLDLAAETLVFLGRVFDAAAGGFVVVKFGEGRPEIEVAGGADL